LALPDHHERGPRQLRRTTAKSDLEAAKTVAIKILGELELS